MRLSGPADAYDPARIKVIQDYFTAHPDKLTPQGIRDTIREFAQYNITIEEIGAAAGKTAEESRAWMNQGTAPATDSWFDAGSPWLNMGDKVQAWGRANNLHTAADYYRVTAGGKRPWDTVAPAPVAPVVEVKKTEDAVTTIVNTIKPSPVVDTAPIKTVAPPPVVEVKKTEDAVKTIVDTVKSPTSTTLPPARELSITEKIRADYAAGKVKLTPADITRYMTETGYTLADIAAASNMTLPQAEAWMRGDAGPPVTTTTSIAPITGGSGGSGATVVTLPTGGNTAPPPEKKADWLVFVPVAIGILSLLK